MKEIRAEFHSKAFILFMEMFKKDLMVNREKLDIAQGDEVLKIQGENRYIKQLLQIAEQRDIKYSKHDGGFGVT